MFGKWKKILKKPDRQKEADLREQIEQAGGLEKGDLPAMILSALLVFVPIALIALLVIVLVGWLLVL